MLLLLYYEGERDKDAIPAQSVGMQLIITKSLKGLKSLNTDCQALDNEIRYCVLITDHSPDKRIFNSWRERKMRLIPYPLSLFSHS